MLQVQCLEPTHYISDEKKLFGLVFLVLIRRKCWSVSRNKEAEEGHHSVALLCHHCEVSSLSHRRHASGHRQVIPGSLSCSVRAVLVEVLSCITLSLLGSSFQCEANNCSSSMQPPARLMILILQSSCLWALLHRLTTGAT